MTALETTFNKSDINKVVYKFSDVNKVVYKFLTASSAKLVDDLNKPCELNLLVAFAELATSCEIFTRVRSSILFIFHEMSMCDEQYFIFSSVFNLYMRGLETINREVNVFR